MADTTGLVLAKDIRVGEIYIYKSSFCQANVIRVTEIGPRGENAWSEGPRVWGYWYNTIEEAKANPPITTAERLFCYWNETNLFEIKRPRTQSGFSKFIQKVEHV